MPKLGIFSGRELRRILEQEGFVMARQRGSHMVMQKRVATGTVTVPVPDHATVRIGTLQSIIRQSGCNREKFTR